MIRIPFLSVRAGHYVPQLADTIVRNNREKISDGPIINLKGFLVRHHAPLF